MNILIVNNSIIPAIKYGGTERVIWGLGKALAKQGHKVSYLVASGSYCPFAEAVLTYNPEAALNAQIPQHIDVVHFNFQPQEKISKPYIVTFHGNVNSVFTFDKNTVFISANQAGRYHGQVFVYNGLDWDDYPRPILNEPRKYFHFLGDASWKAKNVSGAIEITKKAGCKLVVLGGKRLNFNMGFRFTPSPHVSFKGMVANDAKQKFMQQSMGLVFPVLWHEPFGLAIIESLFYGCPVLGTTFGSLPELVLPEVGFLSNSVAELAAALKNAGSFDKEKCAAYAIEKFSATVMCQQYLLLYEKVLGGQQLHVSEPYFSETDILTNKYFAMQP